MKKLTLFTALSLSLFMLASCGKDKKKKNHDLSVSGIIQGSCQPVAHQGQYIPQDLMMQIQQNCQNNQQYFQVRQMKMGQPVYFTATYTQGAYNPYQAQQFQGQQYPGQYQQYPGQQYYPYQMNPFQQQPQYNGNMYTMNGLNGGSSMLTGLSFH